MKEERTAAEAGWHESRYNICAWPADGEEPIIANLYAGTMGRYSPREYALLKSLDAMPETHPALARFAERGLAVDFDERARLESDRTSSVTCQRMVRMTIRPTGACNLSCPYCAQVHHAGKMTKAVQDEVVALASRLVAASGADELCVVWSGGEPLLALDVIVRMTPLLVRAAHETGAGIRATVLTNGYLLDKNAASVLRGCRVKLVRVTMDGVGATHDATRCLANGDATYERILDNLAQPLPFPVEVRMHEHAGNTADAPLLRKRIAAIAQASGNRISFAEEHVCDRSATAGRNTLFEPLGTQDLRRLSLGHSEMRLHGARRHHCVAQGAFNVSVDEAGRLYACPSLCGEPRFSFGEARTWDPADPVATATAPENREWFVHGSLQSNPECHECLWLPTCAGGCARRRLEGRRACVPWRDDPQGYVLAQYERMGEKLRDVTLEPQQLGEMAAPVLRRWGVTRAWVYGSFALGRANAFSDVDMIVEMPAGVTLGYQLLYLRHELKEALGRDVDLHLPPNESISDHYLRVIERQKVLVYEACDGA